MEKEEMMEWKKSKAGGLVLNLDGNLEVNYNLGLGTITNNFKKAY